MSMNTERPKSDCECNVSFLKLLLRFITGGIATILSHHIKTESSYYYSKILEYTIIENPKFGILTFKQLKVDKFTNTQLKNKEIFYHHNGKLNSSDYMKLVAVTPTKESVPFVLNFDINVSEAEAPILIKKGNISCPKNGRVIITNDYLSI